MNFRNFVKRIIPTRIFQKIEPFGHLIEAIIANIRYGFPSRGMQIIGVTGTNGKTTTSFMIAKMLHEAGFKVGLMSTVAYGVGDNIKPQIEHITTAQSNILQRRLKDFRRAGVEWLVLESSSHSLAQYRTWGINYRIAVLTNVTNDHLDYHGTFSNYLLAKRRLFSLAAKHPQSLGVINADDSSAAKFDGLIKNTISYGIKKGDLRANEIKLATDHTDYTASLGKDKYHIHLNIPGDFNVYNSMAAIVVGRELGLTSDQIGNGLSALKNVEGRMSFIDEGQKFKVIVDFASTPDAFERLFENLRPTTKGKLISVFGSAGRRDESKRAIQGEIAGKYSDEVVLTEEDDRDVDGHEILVQISEGAAKAGKIKDKDMFLILDRTEAIRYAFSRAKSDQDTVVLLGKGHEKTIERGNKAYPWNESEVARKLLKELAKTNSKQD